MGQGFFLDKGSLRGFLVKGLFEGSLGKGLFLGSRVCSLVKGLFKGSLLGFFARVCSKVLWSRFFGQGSLVKVLWGEEALVKHP